MIAQHSAGAIGGLLAWGFVIENLLNVFLPARASRLLPFLAGNRLLDPRVRPRLVGAHCDCLQPPTDALVFGAYTAMAIAAGTVLL